MDINLYLYETDTFLRRIDLSHIPPTGSEIEVAGSDDFCYEVIVSKYDLSFNEIRIRTYLKPKKKIASKSRKNFLEPSWLGRLLTGKS